MAKESFTLEEATRKLEGYCAYQDRCHKEVIKKLQDMGMIPIAVDTIISHLIKENFLNEERFAKSFARGKFNIKKWGKQRIIAELRHREISRFNIQTALKEIEGTQYQITFDALAKKRLQQIKETDIQKKKKKLADYLLYRGWESHLVYDKVNELVG
ncbi:RecX family transcriptional regulator [Maribacter algicola]|uniref:Regulatory protein RecX n=1 Tax=Maribacter algicola TaxID=2498892 RepID=A0A3R8RRB4_9FLAO|nr:regulatory protein RecX [Maribacter algicola]RRQ50856.1 RecX family transcriptional regulator [Maribacter algicola]